MNKNNLIGKIKNIYDDEEKSLMGYYNKTNQTFYLFDEENNEVTIDLVNKIILRETKEIKMQLNLKCQEISTCTYFIKDNNVSIDLKVYTNKFFGDDKGLNISYEILDDEERFPFEIKIS